MRKLDQRGVAAFEFCLVAAAFFILVFAIFDLGRYAVTMQSLRKLANAEARAMMICCYTPALLTTPVPSTCPTTTAAASPSGCTGSYLTALQMQGYAPFLFAGGLTPTLTITQSIPLPSAPATPTALVVTASQTNFFMLTPFIWPAAFNCQLLNGSWVGCPSASTQVPL